MNILIKRGLRLIFLFFLCGLIATPIHAAHAKKTTKEISEKEKKKEKELTRFPIGCTPVGYKEHLKIATLFPGKEGALQSMYFFYNKLPQTISLYQMLDKDSVYSLRLNHSIRPNSWAVLATGERKLKFICTLGDGRSSYGKIVDCADTIKICEYVHVKFGLNNKGNFWIVDSNTRNGAVNEVVHYGIIPGV